LLPKCYRFLKICTRIVLYPFSHGLRAQAPHCGALALRERGCDSVTDSNQEPIVFAIVTVVEFNYCARRNAVNSPSSRPDFVFDLAAMFAKLTEWFFASAAYQRTIQPL